MLYDSTTSSRRASPASGNTLVNSSRTSLARSKFPVSIAAMTAMRAWRNTCWCSASAFRVVRPSVLGFLNCSTAFVMCSVQLDYNVVSYGQVGQGSGCQPYRVHHVHTTSYALEVGTLRKVRPARPPHTPRKA